MKDPQNKTITVNFYNLLNIIGTINSDRLLLLFDMGIHRVGFAPLASFGTTKKIFWEQWFFRQILCFCSIWKFCLPLEKCLRRHVIQDPNIEFFDTLKPTLSSRSNFVVVVRQQFWKLILIVGNYFAAAKQQLPFLSPFVL